MGRGDFSGEADRVILNDQVQPAILIKNVLVYGFNKPNRVAEYRNSKTRAKLDEGDLTPKELGLMFNVQFKDGRAYIELPYRICDARVVASLRGLKSLQNENPTVLEKFGRGQTADAGKCSPQNRATAIDFNFSLSKSDYQHFKERVIEWGWLVDELTVDADEVQVEAEALQAQVEDILASVRYLRGVLDAYDNDEEVDGEVVDLKTVYRRLAELMLEAKTTKTELARIEQLCEIGAEDSTDDPFRAADLIYIQLSSPMQLVADAIEQVEQLLVAVEERIKGIRRVAFLSPDKELAALSRLYPQFSWIKVDGDELVISVLGAKIHLTTKTVRVSGDVGALINATEVTAVSNSEIQKPSGRFARWSETLETPSSTTAGTTEKAGKPLPQPEDSSAPTSVSPSDS